MDFEIVASTLKHMMYDERLVTMLSPGMSVA